MILDIPGNNRTSGPRVMSIGVGYRMEADDQAPKRARVMVTPTLGFLKRISRELSNHKMML